MNIFLFHIAVYDINKSTMREKDHYELVFVRYLYNTHNDDICCLSSVSSKWCLNLHTQISATYNGLPSTICNRSHTTIHNTANFFASGSRDGMILLWSTNSLSAMKMFNSTDTLSQPIMSGPSLVQAAETNIRQILAIGEVCTQQQCFPASSPGHSHFFNDPCRKMGGSGLGTRLSVSW